MSEGKDAITAEERYREFLDTLALSDLRVIGRKYGVLRASSSNKEDLVNSISDILTGKEQPKPPTGRGAPPKQNFVAPAILAKLNAIAAEFSDSQTLGVSSPEAQPGIYSEPVLTGILEITQGGYGFLRNRNCQPSKGDIFIPAPAIRSLKLREGDFVACTAKERQKNDSAAIDELLSVNGLPIGRYETRPYFDALTACYPNSKLALSEGNGDLALRTLDLFAPIGKGQRALIIAPPKAGKTTLLKTVARAIAEHHRDLCLIVLLIDERPEEVTDFRMSVENAQIVSSTFDEGAEHHVRAASLMLAHAKRIVELGKDVVILLDSLTKLTRAYNSIIESSGRTLSGGLDAGALAEPKRFFGAARNTAEAGSITILATALVETGSRMDDVIYEEFKGTGNADVFLSRELAEKRVFPAIELRRSGTRKEELLLSKEELSAIYKLRERGLAENTAGVLDMLKRTQDNAQFVARVPDWLRSYKNPLL